MKEITQLVQSFDEHIQLSNGNLYDRFGLDNGPDILKDVFDDIELRIYPDSIEIDEASPLIDYILSCHGNQNQYLSANFNDFRKHVENATNPSFHITKEAGVFICR